MDDRPNQIFAHNSNSYDFGIKIPKPIGWWILDPSGAEYGTRFLVYSKPTNQQIKTTEELLGWRWVDA